VTILRTDPLQETFDIMKYLLYMHSRASRVHLDLVPDLFYQHEAAIKIQMFFRRVMIAIRTSRLRLIEIRAIYRASRRSRSLSGARSQIAISVMKYRIGGFMKSLKMLRRKFKIKALSRMKLVMPKYRRKRFYSIQKGYKAIVKVVINSQLELIFNLMKLFLYANIKHLKVPRGSDVTFVQFSRKSTSSNRRSVDSFRKLRKSLK